MLGVALGAAVGWLLAHFFEGAWDRGHKVRGSVKVLVLLSAAFLLAAAETWLKGRVPLSGLLAVTAMACALKTCMAKPVSIRLSEKFGKLWLAAEVLLFVLVGAAVDVRYALSAGPAVLAMIALSLTLRAGGVLLCLLGTRLNLRERLFCVIAYLPKATVQAAIGGVPLSLGLPCGPLVLTAAVVAILSTAPRGALGMDFAQNRLLTRPGE